MNHPERSSAYVLDENQKKVEYTPDAKTQNTGTFVLNKEDHTIGNLVRMQLLRDTTVRFAGYIMPHPLINKLDLKIQTKDYTTTPKASLQYALDDLINETEHINEKLGEAINDWKVKQSNR
ncbi:hypothetical protein ScalyP_jg8660 [Parmales sp. scaly parma]|nr:hypothetical protein ScalyP_jg8660 [Parmales sp. scaly parma]|tara:strand:- start:212 stop:574 length:363 start_codon:yes stop_codon:yes gene_type:complete